MQNVGSDYSIKSMFSKSLLRRGFFYIQQAEPKEWVVFEFFTRTIKEKL